MFPKKTNRGREGTRKCNLKTRKSPRPDGLSPEAQTNSRLTTLEMMNGLLSGRKFPTKWKEAYLILLLKPGKQAELPAPTCPYVYLTHLESSMKP